MRLRFNPDRRCIGLLPMCALLLGALFLPRATVAQELARATVDRVALSADTIGIGDRFDLTVELTIPAGTVVYLPDSIQSAAFESVEAYRWERADSPDGVVVRVTYPLIAFQVGTITTPDFEAFVALGDVSVAAGGSAPGDVVGEWSVLAEDPSAYAGSRMLGLPSRSLWVGSVLLLDEITEGLAPRPPADVSGGNRNWIATMGLLLFGSLFLVMSMTMCRDWLAARSRKEVPPPDPKSEALLALDALRGDHLLDEGRIRTFFERSSDIVRGYVEQYDAAWSRSRTSTELMGGLRSRVEGAADPLAAEMDQAEAVKFGGARPDPDRSRQHLDTVRAWVAGSEPPVEPGPRTDSGSRVDSPSPAQRESSE